MTWDEVRLLKKGDIVTYDRTVAILRFRGGNDVRELVPENAPIMLIDGIWEKMDGGSWFTAMGPMGRLGQLPVSPSHMSRVS